MTNPNAPIKVHVYRGQHLESWHSVSAVVVDAKGNKIASYGDVKKIFPRSSIKPLQALPVILSGARDKFNLSEEELVLCCASHSGEEKHVRHVSNWLHRSGLNESQFECGAHPPMQALEIVAYLQHNKSPLYNNCSGKHTGMLCTALALNVPTLHYTDFHHPVQKNIRSILEDFCEETLTESNSATDGCSIPTYYQSFDSLALAMAKFGAKNHSNSKINDACKLIFESIIKNPYFLAGSERYCTKMTEALNQKAFVKIGAEGVMFACVPNQQLGIAVKCHDGNARAAESAMSWVLKDLCLLSESEWKKFSQVPVKNWNQKQTGYIEVQA